MTGFVEPFRFSESDRIKLERLLGKHKAGDAEGRRLLIAATEYEIGLCLDGAMRNPELRLEDKESAVSANETNTDLNPIANAAETLSALLKISSEESRQQIENRMSVADPLGRAYGDRFLSCLSAELDRLADSCRQGDEEELPNSEPLPEYALTFLHQMCEIYTECLEVQPTDGLTDPFYQYFNAITEIGGIGPFPIETVLRDFLELN